MFWDWIGKALRPSKNQPQPPTMNEKISAVAAGIDEYYDSLLVEDMTMEQARWVEQQRAAAHAELTRQVMMAAL